MMKHFFNKYNFIIFSLSLIFYLWKSGSISMQITASFFSFGTAWFYMTKRSIRKINKNDAILLTGCDSGLGYSLAFHCLKNLSGKIIAGVHFQNSQGAMELMKNGIHVQQIDITDKQSVEEFVGSVQNYLKKENLCLRALINNAGLMIFGEFEWQTESQIRQQIEVNLLGTMRLTKSMLPLIRRDKSRLIIVTSHCATEPLPGVAAYGSTKAGLAAWTTALRIELKKFDIDVINFIPGSFVGESNILLRQIMHFKAMESEMTDEVKNIYENYFHAYKNYLTPMTQENSLKCISNQRIYEIFDRALMEEPPRATYKCEPWRYTFYHTLLKITPIKIHDYLVNKFVNMPVWEKFKKN